MLESEERGKPRKIKGDAKIKPDNRVPNVDDKQTYSAMPNLDNKH